MARAHSRRTLTLDDYFDVELRSEARHEFLDGEILAMAGASPRHNAVARNLVRALATAARGGPCLVFGSDQRIATPDALYTYPDLSVFCAPPVWVSGRPATASNPTLLVEVLSDATRDYDRGEKLSMYQRIPSLGEVLLVEPATVLVERWVRSAGGWVPTAHRDEGEVLALAFGAALSIAEIYEQVSGLPD